VRDKETEFEKNTGQISLEHQKLQFDGVWCCVSFVLFLLKPSFDTIVAMGTTFMINSSKKVKKVQPLCKVGVDWDVVYTRLEGEGEEVKKF